MTLSKSVLQGIHYFILVRCSVSQFMPGYSSTAVQPLESTGWTYLGTIAIDDDAQDDTEALH